METIRIFERNWKSVLFGIVPRNLLIYLLSTNSIYLHWRKDQSHYSVGRQYDLQIPNCGYSLRPISYFPITAIERSIYVCTKRIYLGISSNINRHCVIGIQFFCEMQKNVPTNKLMCDLRVRQKNYKSRLCTFGNSPEIMLTMYTDFVPTHSPIFK